LQQAPRLEKKRQVFSRFLQILNPSVFEDAGPRRVQSPYNGFWAFDVWQGQKKPMGVNFNLRQATRPPYNNG